MSKKQQFSATDIEAFLNVKILTFVNILTEIENIRKDIDNILPMVMQGKDTRVLEDNIKKETVAKINYLAHYLKPEAFLDDFLDHINNPANAVKISGYKIAVNFLKYKENQARKELLIFKQLAKQVRTGDTEKSVATKVQNVKKKRK